MKTPTRSGFGIPKQLTALFLSSSPRPTNQGCPRSWLRFQKLNQAAPLLVLMGLLAGLHPAVAQPTIVATVPIDGAAGVSPAAAVKFTFSTAMDTNATSVFFLDNVAGESPDAIFVWSSGNKVLTCTPSPQFANNHEIDWTVNGQDTATNYLTTTYGSFTTVAGLNGGSGTNTLTTFEVLKYAGYQQTSAATPALLGYEFYAQTILSSNRSATGITVTIPTTAGVSNLVEDGLEPEMFSKTTLSVNLTSFNTTFPTGNYIFNVSGSSAQQVTVNLPAYTYPNAPQITNYAAAQAVNPSQPFTLGWNTFTNGTTADGIVVYISDDSGTTFYQSAFYGQPGSLNGTARSFTIPAGTFPPNSTNTGTLFFAHVATTSASGIATYAVVGSATGFTLSTTGGSPAAPAPVLTIVPSGNNVLVKWPTNATGYTLQFSTNLASSVWSTTLPAPVVINTNKVVTNSISGTTRFFRLSNP